MNNVANKNPVNNGGLTPLNLAALYGQLEINTFLEILGFLDFFATFLKIFNPIVLYFKSWDHDLYKL